MTNLLLKIFVKNYKHTDNPAIRDRVGRLSSITCIILNVLLAAAKITLGALFGLVSVFADGLNNLTDCGSNVVALVSFKLSDKPADKEHPFGHRRIEYIASTVVAFLVLIVAFELAAEGVSKTVDVFRGAVEAEAFSWWTVGTLAASILVKAWMFAFNRKLAKNYNSPLLKATATDSISDAVATSAVLLSLFVSKWCNFSVDGMLGIAVAVFIAVGGVKILKGTFSSLIGESLSDELIDSINSRIRKFNGVQGVHDLTVHSYGAGKYYASVHVELDSSLSFAESHAIIDGIEKDFEQNTDVKLVIHPDPIDVNDPETVEYRKTVEQIVSQLDEHFNVHDFRAIKGATHVNLVFDLAIHYDTKMKDAEIVERIQRELNEHYENVYVTPTVERQIK